MKRMGTFLKNIKATAALEFALVGPVFFALIFSMIETGWMMTKVSMLDHAVSKASRLIYTGQAPTQAALEQAICDDAYLFTNCTNNIHVELTVISDFSSTPNTSAECLDSTNTAFTPAVNYNSGGSAQIIFMRVCVTTDVLTPGLGLGLAMASQANGRFQIVSATAFMNEPF